jgi:hypothetical protein
MVLLLHLLRVMYLLAVVLEVEALLHRVMELLVVDSEVEVAVLLQVIVLLLYLLRVM